MNSLERSLQFWLAGAMIILMFTFWWSVTLTSRMLTESHVFSQLEQQAYDIHRTADGERAAIQAALDTLAKTYPQRLYLLTSDAGMFRTRPAQTNSHRQAENVSFQQPDTIESLDVPSLESGQSLRISQSDGRGRTFLGWYGGFNGRDGGFVLGVLQDVSSIKEKLAVFQRFAVVFAVLMLTVLLTVQHLIFRASVRKLEAIRRDMMRLEHGQAVALSEDVPSEIMPLVTEFNQLLRRFEQRLRQSRNAVGNLAHSLKGPLNLLIRSTEAEVIGDEQKSGIAQNAQHIRRLIESELKRARLAGRGAVGIRFDADAELPAMIGLLEQVYPEKGVTVSYTMDKHVKLIHDRQDMLELIGNLLDNAVKWAEKEVVLSLRNADGVLIDVEDDGPGCSPELLGRLTGRGVRLDESVAGHGLGLSIVKDIVDTYEGRLIMEPSTNLGGLKVSVYLPQRT